MSKFHSVVKYFIKMWKMFEKDEITSCNFLRKIWEYSARFLFWKIFYYRIGERLLGEKG
jgi:hypothetical protein